MEIYRKDNGLYCIDDISLEDMTKICTLYRVAVMNAEERRGTEIKDLRELAIEFNNQIEKALWTSKKN